MAYKIICTENENHTKQVRGDYISSWRQNDPYFLNKKDNICFSNIRSARDIAFMKYEILKETIYSNHYDGIVFIDLRHESCFQPYQLHQRREQICRLLYHGNEKH